MSHLNLISLLGILIMVGIAWLMSSHKTRVDWRLVVFGLILQLCLAAVLFQSQNWTFKKTFDDFASLKSAVDDGEFPTAGINDLLRSRREALASTDGNETATAIPVSFEDAIAAIESDTTSPIALTRILADNTGQIRISRYPNGILFAAVESFFGAINSYVAEGAGFMFGINGIERGNPTDPKSLVKTFAFGVLPTVIFFASLMSILYHIGIMQYLIRGMAWVMQKTLRTSGAESLAAAANVLVGHTEAPLVIRPYVAGMTRSELNALMVGGFSTISGSLMAIFVLEGISAGHLLTASIISAPAALVIAKILQPETETPGELATSNAAGEKIASNVIEAAAIGAGEGMKLAINIAAMLIAFLALIAMLNALLFGVGELLQWIINAVAGSGTVEFEWTLSRLFGAVFFPLAWIMGIETADCDQAGQLLGTKMVVNEFVAYLEMGGALADGNLSKRSEVILTYALCGFSNFGAIGIQIGGIGPLAPSRRGHLAQLGLRAMFGGMLACCMTACMAGLMYGVLR